MENGEIAIKNDEFKEAKAYYKEALDIKNNDETAAIYLKQTEYMIDSLNALENNQFEEAKKHLKYVNEEEQGLKSLRDKADAYLKELTALKETYKEVELLLADSQSAKENGNYAEAKERLDQIKKLELEHAFFKTLLENASQINEEVKAALALQENVTQQYEEAKRLKSEQKNNEALAIIQDTLSSELNNPGLTELKSSLENLQNDIITEQKNAEIAKKKQSIINGAKGYWANSDIANHYCYFGDSSYVCATAETDESYFDHITKWDADIEKNAAIIHFKDGTIFNMPVGDHSITLYNGKYNRTSKEALSDGRLGVDVNDFFDINQYNDDFSDW